MFKTMLKATVAASAFFLAAAAAHAQQPWRYAQWGMSPEEVVAASKGQAVLVPHKIRTLDEVRKFEALSKETGMSLQKFMLFKGAKSQFETGGISFEVAYMFDDQSKKLIEVLVGKDRCDATERNHIKYGLSAEYGRPTEDYNFAGESFATWKTRSEVIDFNWGKELGNDGRPVGGWPEARECLIAYSPLPKL
jgi:hypothetical protein